MRNMENEENSKAKNIVDETYVTIVKGESTSYPSFEYFYSPSEIYPEYLFSDSSNEKNEIYDLVRRVLYDLNLDTENYGTSGWNPLGKFLYPGQTVVVKPNFVMHENENKSVKENSMECLVTHPSCIRAILDYCVKALVRDDGTIDGRIVVADAPMQGCMFDTLVKKMHLDELISYYSDRGIRIELIDLRQFQTKFNRNKVIIEKKYTESKGIIVHVGDKSMHIKAHTNGHYQVSDYAKEETVSFHHGRTHDYALAENILQADLLINFSKPKTHRLAGITAALKNMVGATYNKASLPHRVAGAKSEGGDAYLHKNLLKKVADEALTVKIHAENRGNVFLATVMRYCYGAFLVAGRTLGKDNYYIGSWYGNDTIWRTMIDLNYAVKYADKQGQLHHKPQRNILYLADMIVSGQRNGPVSPEPKNLGIICGSFDGAAMDRAVCRLMGFAPEKIPYLKAIQEGDTWIEFKDPQIKSNIEQCNGLLSDVIFPESWRFKPHDTWSEVLGES